MDPNTAARLRRAFKLLNRFIMLPLWRLGLGGWVNCWPSVGGRIMVIAHTGRKTGRRRRTPVNYACIDGEVYCLSGFGGGSDWYRNIQVRPEVEVWLPDGWWAGVAKDVTDTTDQRLLLLRQVLIGSGFAAYLAGINPHTLTDQALDSATATYRLLHIRRREARTGPGGPGNLAWVWPATTTLLLPLLLVARRRKRGAQL
ncbi:MAG: hypothetical protein CL878_14780 [Dehalococcoidia bacterium]|nr:hypothetical protein [Dehalococcoidia bacterium]